MWEFYLYYKVWYFCWFLKNTHPIINIFLVFCHHSITISTEWLELKLLNVSIIYYYYYLFFSVLNLIISSFFFFFFLNCLDKTFVNNMINKLINLCVNTLMTSINVLFHFYKPPSALLINVLSMGQISS